MFKKNVYQRYFKDQKNKKYIDIRQVAYNLKFNNNFDITIIII